MALLIKLKSHSDNRGHLTVIEKDIPFKIKRVFYIYGVDKSIRGGHGHKRTKLAAVCVYGSCIIYTNNGLEKKSYTLDKPDKCLILEPEDWHTMHNFSKDAVLLMLASEYYDPDDYFYEEYK